MDEQGADPDVTHGDKRPAGGDVEWSRVGWISLGVVLAAIFGYVVFAFLGTFVTGVFLYYSLRPFHTRIERYVGQQTLAATATVLVLAIPAIGLVGYAAAIAVQELYAFAQETDFGPVQEILEPYVDLSTAIEQPGSLLQNPGSLEPIFGSLAAALAYLGLVGTVLLHLFVVFAIAFYLLRDDQRIARVGSILTDRNEALAAYTSAVDTSLQRIFFGNLLNAFITGGIGVVVYSAMNVFAPDPVSIPYPALLGVLTGIGSMIPVVGMKIVYVPVGIIMAVNAATSGEGWVFVGAFVGISAVVVDMIPDFLLRPYVSGRSLHVGAVMLAYVLGPLLFGWYGIFLGPLLLVVMVHFYRIVLPELLAGVPVQAGAVEPRAAGAGGNVGPATEAVDPSSPGADAASTDTDYQDPEAATTGQEDLASQSGGPDEDGRGDETDAEADEDGSSASGAE